MAPPMIFDVDLVPWNVLASLLAVVVWAAFGVRVVRVHERRTSYRLMGVVGLLVALGMLASAWASAQVNGWDAIVIDHSTLALIAGMGRGALIMGGIFAIAATRRRA